MAEREVRHPGSFEPRLVERLLGPHRHRLGADSRPRPRGEDGAFIQHLDWKRFVTHQVVDFVKAERDAVKAVDPSIPCTTNFMYYHNDYNYFKFKDELDVICWDAYPQWRGGNNAKLASIYGLWHDAMRSIKRQPFLLMESTPSTANWWPVSKLKKPGQHRMSSMQAVAHGSNSVQYFQFRKSRGAFEKFHGAVVDHKGGTEPREFQDVKAMGQLLERIDAVTQSDVHAQVALVFDWENRWAIDDAQGPEQGHALCGAGPGPLPGFVAHGHLRGHCGRGVRHQRLQAGDCPHALPAAGGL